VKQKAEDADISEKQIMDWAKQNVGEKAAVPREIMLVNEIPLRPVGKIFKPALRHDATRRAYESEIEALGDLAESVEVTMEDDKQHGTRADIRVKPAPGTDMETIREKINELLARYTVYYTVEKKA
jgi:fatty-acyl-CoA synthase